LFSNTFSLCSSIRLRDKENVKWFCTCKCYVLCFWIRDGKTRHSELRISPPPSPPKVIS
jgi:hypothetical protein